MQQTDLKEIVKNDSGSPYNNKAMMSDNSVSSDSIALFIFSLVLNVAVNNRGGQGNRSSIKPARSPTATCGLGNNTYSVAACAT